MSTTRPEVLEAHDTAASSRIFVMLYFAANID
jgi:hypothetical protein